MWHHLSGQHSRRITCKVSRTLASLPSPPEQFLTSSKKFQLIEGVSGSGKSSCAAFQVAQEVKKNARWRPLMIASGSVQEHIPLQILLHEHMPLGVLEEVVTMNTWCKDYLELHQKEQVRPICVKLIYVHVRKLMDLCRGY